MEKTNEKLYLCIPHGVLSVEALVESAIDEIGGIEDDEITDKILKKHEWIICQKLMRTIEDFLGYVERSGTDDLEYADICISLVKEVVQVINNAHNLKFLEGDYEAKKTLGDYLLYLLDCAEKHLEEADVDNEEKFKCWINMQYFYVDLYQNEYFFDTEYEMFWKSISVDKCMKLQELIYKHMTLADIGSELILESLSYGGIYHIAYEWELYDKAIEAIHKSIEYYYHNNEEMNRSMYWISLGEIYEILENMEEAINAFEHLIQDELFDKSDKLDLTIWLHYCQLLIKRGKYDIAIQSLKELQVYAECLENDNEDICKSIQFLQNCLEQGVAVDTSCALEEFWEKFRNE